MRRLQATRACVRFADAGLIPLPGGVEEFVGAQGMTSESRRVHSKRPREVPMPANTDWLRDARWGVFVHYLADIASNTEVPDLTPDEWNRRIDGFDVKGLADQLEAVGAGYFFITLGQNSGFYLSPNATYDAIVGHQPNRCSERDLVADLIAELQPRGIRMMVYFTACAPALDRLAIEALKCTPPNDARQLGFHPELYSYVPGVDDRLTEFQGLWEQIIREWSLRWGAGCAGWWIDGCYNADAMYRHPEAPNFASLAAALKAGNPDSLVAFNPGVKVPVVRHSEHEDYTAGEISDAFPAPSIHGQPALGRYVDGAQYQILTYLGEGWGQGAPRFPDEFVIGYTKLMNSHEGVLTWDTATTRQGLITAPCLAQLRALGAATR